MPLPKQTLTRKLKMFALVAFGAASSTETLREQALVDRDLAAARPGHVLDALQGSLRRAHARADRARVLRFGPDASAPGPSFPVPRAEFLAECLAECLAESRMNTGLGHRHLSGQFALGGRLSTPGRVREGLQM